MFHACLVSTLHCLSGTLLVYPLRYFLFSRTNLLQDATVPVPFFLLFLVPEKSENEYSRNWTGQKPKSIFYRGEHGARRRDGEGHRGGHTPWPHDLAHAWGGAATSGTPSASLFAYKKP